MIAKRIDVTTSASSERASVSARRRTVADDGQSTNDGEGNDCRRAGFEPCAQAEGGQVDDRPCGKQPQWQSRRLRPPQPALGYPEAGARDLRPAADSPQASRRESHAENSETYRRQVGR